MANKNKKKPVQQVLSPNKLIKERGRTYPVHKCYISKNWQQEGLAVVTFIRKMGGDKYLLGSYIVDIFCLGIKDAFAKVFDEIELRDYLKQSQWENEECDTTLAQNVIYGAMEYAEDLGFKPHPDFGLAKYVLDDIEAIEYMEIEFGKDGKPFYMQGPNDKYLHILATLDKNVGAGNYNYLGMYNRNEDDDYDEDDDFEAVFDENAVGLHEQDYLNYLFAFKTAYAMDELEDEYEDDFESIPEEARMNCLQGVRDDIYNQITNHETLSQAEREESMAFEAANPLIVLIKDLSESLLDGIVEYEQTFQALPDSFVEVANYFYAIRVKEQYGQEKTAEENDDYIDFEEVK